MQRCAAAAFLLLLLTPTADATDIAYQRAVDAALASPILPVEIVVNAIDECADALCFAKTLSKRLPDHVRLERVAHPDTDTIRLAKTSPSVTIDDTAGNPALKITHFGRRAAAELRAASATGSLPVDLRGNGGGDVERMLEIAGLLIGARRDVVEIDHGDRVERLSIAGSASRSFHVPRVMIDEDTASAALLLARLLEAHADAEVVGPRPADGPVHLKRRITVDHDWRLILPVAEITVVRAGN